MAGSYAYDGTLLDVAGQGVAVDGDWFEVLSSGSTERRLSNIQYIVSMTAGTGTWVLEGRNGPNDSPTQIDTGTASKTGTYSRMAQMRLRWTAAAGLTARGSVNCQLQNVTYTPFAVQQSVWYNGLIGGYWPSSGALFRYVPGDSLASATFTRGSNATYVDASGIIQTAGNNVPRDAHYINGVRTLLLESQSTNLCLNSLPQSATNGWTVGSGFTLTSNFGTGPQGTPGRSARIQGTGAGVAKFVLTVGASTQYTLSFWAKLNSGNPFFKVSDQTDANLVVAYQSYAGQVSAGQWRRVSITFTTGAGYTSANVYVLNDSTADIEIDGVQLEQLGSATSTIFTSGATVTRTADLIFWPFAATPQPMSAYIKAVYNGQDGQGNGRFIQVGKNDNSQPFFVLWNPTPRLTVSDSVGTQLTGNSPDVPTFGDTIELDGVWQANGLSRCDSCKNGGSIDTGPQSSGTFIAFPGAYSGLRISVGMRDTNVDQLCLAVSKVVLTAGDHSITELRAA